MKRTMWCSYLGLLLVGMLASPVVAQSNETPTETPSATNASAADLKITPRFGVGHTSSGAGFDGFTRFSGFISVLLAVTRFASMLMKIPLNYSSSLKTLLAISVRVVAWKLMLA
ncbi:hypothetical protein [Coleofasciculus sp.]|uniref:hypothetical protein n=1 Tax=Coleofasciculus sp. TaxID=3100458 RepID=UPI003A3DD2EB